MLDNVVLVHGFTCLNCDRARIGLINEKLGEVYCSSGCRDEFDERFPDGVMVECQEPGRIVVVEAADGRALALVGAGSRPKKAGGKKSRQK